VCGEAVPVVEKEGLAHQTPTTDDNNGFEGKEGLLATGTSVLDPKIFVFKTGTWYGYNFSKSFLSGSDFQNRFSFGSGSDHKNLLLLETND
jgi:hypothetical protein